MNNKILWAGQICQFLTKFSETSPENAKRFSQAGRICLPFGDLAYGQALYFWHLDGQPKDAYFSWAPGEKECPMIMEFRKELSEYFGLEILTIQEGQDRAKQIPSLIKKCYDWGLN